VTQICFCHDSVTNHTFDSDLGHFQMCGTTSDTAGLMFCNVTSVWTIILEFMRLFITLERNIRHNSPHMEVTFYTGYPKLLYITLHYITLHYITLHYTALYKSKTSCLKLYSLFHILINLNIACA